MTEGNSCADSSDDVHDDPKDLLLQVPTLVIDNLLKYLRGKELLTLRRVCKTTKAWVTNSTNRDAWTGYRLDIKPDSEGYNTFEAAVRSGLNVTEIFINNSGDEGIDIYNSPSMLAFARTYGPHIRKLKVQNFGTFFNDNEFIFFQSLTNLTELKLQIVDARKRPDDDKATPRFPSCFQDLKVLKFGDIMSPAAPAKTSYHWTLVAACPHLEYLRFPVASQDFDGYAQDDEIDTYYDNVMDYINIQNKSARGLTLKTLDLKYVVGDDDHILMCFGFPVLLLFLHCEMKNQIQVKNAHAEMIFPNYTQYGGHPTYTAACNNVIQSMTNLQPFVRTLELPNMTKLVINSTCYSCIHHSFENAPEWPSLKNVSVLIDSANQNVPHIVQLLFNSRVRSSVTKLSLVLDEDILWSMELEGLLRSSRVLARNFSNVRVLELVRWNIKNVSFLKLWEGLNQLEELTVEDCSTFGNVALIGTEEQNPTFLKLKKLRKITMKLDWMPLVTDRAFRDVFSKMKLKEFYLRASSPLQKITESGILNLLEGEFGRSIEKFPFKTWSLASLSYQDFKLLGRKFRSIL